MQTPTPAAGGLGSVSETLELSGGTAKVYLAHLPEGGRVDVNLRLNSGPAVDLWCLDEENLGLALTGDYPNRFRALTSPAVTEWTRTATLPAGKWAFVINGGAIREKARRLVVDLRTGEVDSSLGSLRTNEDLATAGQSGLAAIVELEIKLFPTSTPASQVPVIPLDLSCLVEAHQQYSHTFTVAEQSVPGRLTGVWSSTGQSVGLEGASDDALVSFELRGVTNYPLQKSGRSMSGTFDLWIREPGTLTFIFNNSPGDSSSRQVKLKGTYQPN